MYICIYAYLYICFYIYRYRYRYRYRYSNWNINKDEASMNKTGTHGTLIRIEKNEPVRLKWASWWLGNVILIRWDSEKMEKECWHTFVTRLGGWKPMGTSYVRRSYSPLCSWWYFVIFRDISWYFVIFRDISLSSLLGAKPVLGSCIRK